LRKGESLKITQNRQGEPKPRKFFKFWDGGGVRFNVPNNDMRSIIHGIVERVFYVKIGGVHQRPPKFATDANRLDGFKNKLTTLLGELRACSPIEFVERYAGNKRKMYATAANSLLEEPLSWEDSKIKAFTKAEYLKPGGVPRLIQPRSPRYNVALGCFLSPNEKTILHGVDQLFSREIGDNDHSTVAKGHNFKKRGAIISRMWDQYNDPVCIGLDVTRYDQHVNETLLLFEHSIYEQLFNGQENNPYYGQSLSTILKWQRRNHCSWTGKEGKVSYTTRGCRMSGDMNTSLGNVLIATGLWFTYLTETKRKFHLYNDGDDSCIICDRKTSKQIIKDIEPWFKQFGISMVVEGVFNSLEEITFCQAKPVFDGTDWYLCPNPHKRCFSDLCTLKDMTSAKLMNLQLGAIAACGLAANGSTPILNEMYKKMGTGVELFIPDRSHHLYKFRQELVDGLKPEFVEPTFDHRISFYHAFDITPEEQLIVERFYRDKLPILQHQISDRSFMFDITELSLLRPTLKPCLTYEGCDADDGRRVDFQ